MRQHQGAKKAIPDFGVANGAPSGTDGLLMSAFQERDRCLKYSLLVELGAAGAFTADLRLWLMDDADVWGYAGDNNGALNGGLAIAGSVSGKWYLPVENIGWAKRVYVQSLNETGAPSSAAASLIEILDNPYAD